MITKTETKALSQFLPSPSPLALTLADARSREGEVLSQFDFERGVGPRARAEQRFKRSQLATRLETKWCRNIINLKGSETALCPLYTLWVKHAGEESRKNATALRCIHTKM